MATDSRIGIILINTGTTAAPKPAETREYLREFLSDPRVIDKPAWLRWILLNVFILPTRPKSSAEAYEAVWTDEGSPLLVISNKQAQGIRDRISNADVVVGMRYGSPSIPDAVEQLYKSGVDRIIAAPLFPQYSSAANGSALELVYKLAGEKWNVPAISALPEFYNEEGFIDSWVEVTRPVLEDFNPDHVLFSYHGLPESQVTKSDDTGQHCLKFEGCCDAIVDANRHCYRAQCYATTRSLVDRLGLTPDNHTTTFQSRLGRDPWIKPATDEFLLELPGRGVKRLAVLCPAFVTDCLETLEEIGIRAKEDFIGAGGEDLVQVPCLNDHPVWLDTLADMLKRI